MTRRFDGSYDRGATDVAVCAKIPIFASFGLQHLGVVDLDVADLTSPRPLLFRPRPLEMLPGPCTNVYIYISNKGENQEKNARCLIKQKMAAIFLVVCPENVFILS